jgi:hypothetical protein
VNKKNVEKAKAMQCLGKLIEIVEKDPDPLAETKYKIEYNCANCDSFRYCDKLADTLYK